LSAKLVPTFEDRGVSRGQRNRSHGHILGFLDQSRYYFFQVAPQAERNPFQTYYFSENLIAPGIDPETSGSVARNSDH
jgi:hypothetical protein